MMSKPVKDDVKVNRRLVDPDELPLLQRIVFHLQDWFCYIPEKFIRVHYNRLCRALFFFKLTYNNYDWDFHYVYELMYYKLKRLQKSLLNGHLHQDPKDLKALKELINIVFKLMRDNFDRKYLIQHDRKWGKIESRSIPMHDADGKIKYYRYESWRSGTLNKSEKIQEKERKEHWKCYEKAEKDRNNLIDKMAYILKNHERNFWD